jgi:hypothetical protein
MRQSTPFFYEKDLKNWLESLKKYSSQENIFICNNLLQKEKHQINSSCDLTKYFIEKLFKEEHYLEPLEPKQDSKIENSPKNSSTEENLQNLGISNFKSKLREKFSRGTQEDFEKITKEIDPEITQIEAEKIFEKLVDQGNIAMDPEGWWRWTK